MPRYHSLGTLPPKRHTVYRKADGGLYYEELIGNRGFSGPSSLAYHVYRPTEVLSTRLLAHRPIEAEAPGALRMRHFFAARIKPGPSPTLDRVPLLFNAECTISLASAAGTEAHFYRNGQADELLYVSDGEGVLQSMFGELDYRRGDYLVIPKGVIWRLAPAAGVEHRLLVVESSSFIRTPSRYRNEYGQLLEHAPFMERDVRVPSRLPVYDETGEYRVVVRTGDTLTETVYRHHPFDVVGWDGFYYPWAFSIHDFAPIVGKLHLPPPIHQTFQSDGFVVCSFCPRPFDFDPAAVPAPYNHTNVDSEEVIYYAKDGFMSRKGVEYGSITFHPDGLTHGPHPGRMEASIGQTFTDELAVMIDTFRPLKVAAAVLPVEDPAYARSWLE